jgi:hypothetical protein
MSDAMTYMYWVISMKYEQNNESLPVIFRQITYIL